MTSVSGIAQGARGARQDAARWEMMKAAAAENSGRFATSTSTFKTYGVGSILISQAITFDMPFTSEPTVATGFSLLKTSNPVFQLPIANCGVRQWVRDKNLYRGALVYVTIAVDELPDGLRPLKPSECKTQAMALQQCRVLDLPREYSQLVFDLGPGDITDAKKIILEDAWDEQAPEWLKVTTVVHSVTFSGIALKDVPTDGVDDDPAATPRTTTISGA